MEHELQAGFKGLQASCKKFLEHGVLIRDKLETTEIMFFVLKSSRQGRILLADMHIFLPNLLQRLRPLVFPKKGLCRFHVCLTFEVILDGTF